MDNELKNKLKNFEWNPKSFLDLHSMGVHYFDPDCLPTQIDVLTHSVMHYKGLTQPNCLPRYNDSDMKSRIEEWFNRNFYKLHQGGIQIATPTFRRRNRNRTSFSS